MSPDSGDCGEMPHRKYARVWLPPLSQSEGLSPWGSDVFPEHTNPLKCTEWLAARRGDPGDRAARTAFWGAGRRSLKVKEWLAQEAKSWKQCGCQQYNVGKHHWVTKWTTVIIFGLFNRKQHKRRLWKCNHPQWHLQTWRNMYWLTHVCSFQIKYLLQKAGEQREEQSSSRTYMCTWCWMKLWLPLLRAQTSTMPCI